MTHRTATPLSLVLATLVFCAGTDGLVRTVISHIGSSDPEVSGWVSPAHVVSADEAGGYHAPAAAPTPRPEPLHGTVSRNSSLYDELRALGVSAFDIDQITRDTRTTFNWRRIRPGQRFDVYPTADGGVDSLLLFTDPASYVRVTRDGDGYVATKAQVPYQVTYHVAHGTIYDSVYASLKEIGAATELAGTLDEIFGWTLDLAKDLRDGDEYVLLYETRDYETGYSKIGNVLAARVVNEGHEYDAIRFKSGDQVAYYDLTGKSLQKSMRRAPLKFTRVSSSFSHRRFHPIEHMYMPHYGTDYAAPKGTPIYATGDGVVVAAQYRTGNGNYVKIHHNDRIETYYLHMSGFAHGIHRGVHVSEGQVIGFVGMTGWATAPHVCYRVTVNGKWVNSRTLQLPSMHPVPAIEMANFEATRDAYLSRIHGALMDGLDNRSTVVEAPEAAEPLLRASAF